MGGGEGGEQTRGRGWAAGGVHGTPTTIELTVLCRSVGPFSVRRFLLFQSVGSRRRGVGAMATWWVFLASMVAVLLQSSGPLYFAEGANWAQVSGNKYQNAVTNPETRWSPRWGHAAAPLMLQRPEPCEYPEGTDLGLTEDELEERKRAKSLADDKKILVMGGDTHKTGDGGGYYMNEVWESTGAIWLTVNSTIEFDYRNEPIARIISQATWKLASPNKATPLGVDYNTWTACARSRFEHNRPCDDSLYIKRGAIKVWHPEMKCKCDLQNDPYPGRMWAPRRNMAAVGFRRQVFILGGRARAMEDIPLDESLSSIPDGNRKRWRERTLLMNDVWTTEDGENWNMANPGCDENSPQNKLVIYNGHAKSVCRIDSDCFGNARCISRTCICNMWSPRERHAAVVYPDQQKVTEKCAASGPEQRIYVFGGFSRRYTQRCGTNACGGDYREFMHDVWRTKKECIDIERAVDPVGCRDVRKTLGEEWELIIPAAPWPGRGGHQVVSHLNMLFVMGGRGGSLKDASDNPLYNDVWRSADAGKTWQLVVANAEWPAREHFFAASLENSTGQPTMQVVFGFDGENKLQDVWESYTGAHWVEDFSNLTETSAYATFDSPLESLQTLTEGEIAILNEQGISTIQELADIDKGTVMYLRGGNSDPDPLDGPAMYRGGPFPFICPHRHRAMAFVEKCTVRPPRVDGADQQPDTVVKELIDEKKKPIEEEEEEAEDYDPDGCTYPTWMREKAREPEDILEEETEAAMMLPVGDFECFPMECVERGGYQSVSMLRECADEAAKNYAVQVANAGTGAPEKEPEMCVQHPVNITCKVVPTPRESFAGVIIQQRLFILGGLLDKDVYENDVWYRDAKMPAAVMTVKPTTETSEQLFQFASDEEGCIFEYRLWLLDEDDLYFEEIVRNWTLMLDLTYIQDWMPPGGGKYRFELRAIDPAGNVDQVFEEGRNVHTWIYEPPLPVGLIVGSVLGFFALVGAVYLEVRRRKKKAAMERYAIKRMRRKFKGVQRNTKGKKGGKKKGKKGKKGKTDGDADDPEKEWREYYDEGKGIKSKKDKKKKKKKDDGADGKKKKKKDKKEKKDKKKKSKK